MNKNLAPVLWIVLWSVVALIAFQIGRLTVGDPAKVKMEATETKINSLE